jgi:hypothetical protein
MALDRLLLQKPVQWKTLRRALTDRGYAIYEPYIVYKGCRVGKFEVNPEDDSVIIYTHSRRRGYCRAYLVRDLEIAMQTIRKSYKNFLYAAERPGVVVREVKVQLRNDERLWQMH